MDDSAHDSPSDSGGGPPDDQGAQDKDTVSAAELEAAGQAALFDGEGVSAQDPKAEAEGANDDATRADPRGEGEQAAQPYRVLARKYRPQSFSELIGQEPMVRTLANAIARDRLAHAFLMTGVRGVGKTTTARLIAKALNCIGPDGQGGPTIEPCGVCEPCRAIAEGRHIDVIEMDAASNRGIDTVRELTEAVRYAAVSARYKIYIIDEVHMMTKEAFNALLKTLEEPPPHVKFLFATTEVEKLPVTVLSRCQRFDLKRIPIARLEEHFAEICRKEGVEAESEALHLIAAAAEGSVRDGLSILDQAIAHADLDGAAPGEPGRITAERLRDMLGLADRGAQRRLLEDLLAGETRAMLEKVEDQYALGVEPLALMRGLMELVHRMTVAKMAKAPVDVPGEDERAALGALSERLSPAQLHRLWQLLLKGYDEVRMAPDPLIAAQMALLRIAHAAQLPGPGELARKIEALAQQGAAASTSLASTSAGSEPSARDKGDGGKGDGGKGNAGGCSTGAPIDDRWRALVERLENAGQLRIAQLMRDWVRVVALEEGRLVYDLVEGLADDPREEIREALAKVTGERWRVERANGAQDARPSLREQDQAAAEQARARRLAHPLVRAVFEHFPDAQMLEGEGEIAQLAGREKNERRA